MKNIIDENKQIKNELNELRLLIKNNNNQITNNIQNNNIQNNNINIISFGKEDYDKLTQQELKRILYCYGPHDGLNPILRAINSVHFNKNIPEQNNIKLKSVHTKYVRKDKPCLSFLIYLLDVDYINI